MKLEHLSGIAAVGFFDLALAGCASQAPSMAAKAAPTNAVGTTQLMSAEMHVDGEQLKVGKSQQHITDEAVSEDEPVVKDSPRRSDRHRGGGFSGWK